MAGLEKKKRLLCFYGRASANTGFMELSVGCAAVFFSRVPNFEFVRARGGVGWGFKLFPFLNRICPHVQAQRAGADGAGGLCTKQTALSLLHNAGWTERRLSQPGFVLQEGLFWPDPVVVGGGCLDNANHTAPSAGRRNDGVGWARQTRNPRADDSCQS